MIIFWYQKKRLSSSTCLLGLIPCSAVASNVRALYLIRPSIKPILKEINQPTLFGSQKMRGYKILTLWRIYSMGKNRIFIFDINVALELLGILLLLFMQPRLAC